MPLPRYMKGLFKATSGTTRVDDTTGLSTVTQIDSALGTIESWNTSGNQGSASDNREIRFLNKRLALSLGTTSEGLYELVSGTWTLQHTPTNITADVRTSGLHICYDGGIPILTWAYQDSVTTGRHRAVTTTDVSSFTNTQTSIGTDFPFNAPVAEIVYKNKLHYCCGVIGAGVRDAFLMVWDPVALSFTKPTQPTIFNANVGTDRAGFDLDFFILNHRLFAIYYANVDAGGDGDMTLAEYTGSWDEVLTIHTDTLSSGTSPYTTKPTIIFDQTNRSAIAVVWAGTTTSTMTWRAYEIKTSPSLSATLLTSGNYLPTSFATSQNRVNERWRRITDHSDPDNPGFYLLHNADASSEGNSFSLYTHNGASSLIGNSGSPEDIGARAFDSFPNHYASGGERTYFSGEISAEFTADPAAASGGTKYTFKVYGVTGSETVSIKLRYNEYEEPDFSNVATLSSVSGGSATLNVDNQTINNVTANGTTDYTATVNISAVPFGLGDIIYMALEVIQP